jgi:hypothetical protein
MLLVTYSKEDENKKKIGRILKALSINLLLNNKINHPTQ